MLAELVASGGDPAAIAGERGYEALGRDDLATFVDAVMKASKDKADGKAVTALLEERAQRP